MNSKHKNLLIVVVVVVVTIFVLWVFPSLPIATISPPLPSASTAQATLVIFDGTTTTLDMSVPIVATSTVFSVLRSATTRLGIVMTYKDYPGTGYLITQIGDKANGTSEAYWQYRINNAYVAKSADQQPVHNGDVIDWKFIASQ